MSKKKDLINAILSFRYDICFNYSGKSVCINPWNENKFEIGYGDTVKTFKSIDDLMTAKIFDGRNLNSIANEIDFICV